MNHEVARASRRPGFSDVVPRVDVVDLVNLPQCGDTHVGSCALQRQTPLMRMSTAARRGARLAPSIGN